MCKELVSVLGLILALASHTAAAQPREKPQDAPADAKRTLQFHVIECATKRPVPGFTVTTGPYYEGQQALERSTDAKGHCSILIPADTAGLARFRVQTFKDGYVPVEVRWGFSPDQLGRIPDAYTLMVDPAAPIGGVVRDEQNRPVAGARVFPFFHARRGDLENLTVRTDFHAETGADGRWRCTILPPSWESGKIDFRVEHPHFVSSESSPDISLPIKELRAFAATIVLKTGFTLDGTVTDVSGKPVKNAEVTLWSASSSQDKLARARSDAGGSFRFENLRPGVSHFVVEEAGCAPSVKRVRFGPENLEKEPVPVTMEGRDPPPAPPEIANQLAKKGPCQPPLVFRIGPGRTIRGRVESGKGQPVPGATVSPISIWYYDCRSKWQSTTDADGRFEWRDAPLDVITLTVRRPNEEREISVDVAPECREVVVKMPTPFHIHGKVVDADTGNSIERFRLTTGVDTSTGGMAGASPKDDDRRLSWNRDDSKIMIAGHFDANFPFLPLFTVDRYSAVFRVDAEGYAPAVSRYFLENESEICYDFKLRKRPWIKGTVRLPDSTPAAGADVCLLSGIEPAPRIRNGQLTGFWNGERVKTASDGRFTFATPDERAQVVVLSDKGFALRHVDRFASDPIVTITPWARIHGHLRIGGKPDPGQSIGACVQVSDESQGREIELTSRAETGADGQFNLERVAPGAAFVYRLHWFADGTAMRSQRAPLDVAPGKLAEITLGGSGRAILGRVALAPGLPQIEFPEIQGRLHYFPPQPKLPDGFADWDPIDVKEWWKQFYRTDEGKKYARLWTVYAVKINTNGSFRVEDVPVGHYRLDFVHRTRSLDLGGKGLEEVATTLAESQTPLEVSAEPRDEPIDLGELTLKPPKTVQLDR